MRHALINLAEIAYEENNLDEALAYIQKALEKRESYWGLNLSGKIHKRRGSYEEAVRDFSQAHKLDPMHVHALTSRGEMYRSSRALDQALDDFNKALEISPKNVFSLVRRANVYMQQKNFDHAAVDFKTVSKLSLSTGENRFAQGCLHLFAGESRKAEICLNLALKLNPEDGLFLVYRGYDYLQKKIWIKHLSSIQMMFLLDVYEETCLEGKESIKRR